MIAAEKRIHRLRKILDLLENIAQVRANLLLQQNEIIEQLDLEGKHRNFSPEEREIAADYLRMIRGEDQR